MTGDSAPAGDLPVAVARVRTLLAGIADGQSDAAPPLDRIERAFGLSPFERDLMLLCCGVELDREVAAAVGKTGASVDFGLAMARLPAAHWSACAPEAPLRRWRLVEMGPGPLMQAPLTVDERVLQFLLGQGGFDEKLALLLDWLPPAATLAPSHAALADDIAARWSTAQPPPIVLSGRGDEALAVVAMAAARLEAGAMTTGLGDLPTGEAELDSFVRLWGREAALSGARVLAVDARDAADDPAAAAWRGLARLADRISGPLAVIARTPRPIGRRPVVSIEVSAPTRAEQAALWRAALGDRAPADAAIDAVAAQFILSTGDIQMVADEAIRAAGDAPPTLWELCRRRLRGGLDGLARRVEGGCTWDDLVLPEPQLAQLRAIAGQLRVRGQVYDGWGFGAGTQRGQGVNVLFHGPSGAGKTLAAEVLAGDLALDLYHIDLSRIVSKYIGETEANLRRIFDAAENNGAMLLFDEADSLFGTRSEVKDSHDRYANLEVSYLLQRMEEYRGLAVLTTNMRSALDPAFLRRLRHAVAFPFPDAPQRAAIWRRAFPAAAQLDGVDVARLAALRLAGGNIRNIALNAAFLAADAGAAIGMDHLRRAAEAEYAKLERRLTPAEAAAWA